MNTINDSIDLSYSYGCSTEILNIDTGLKTNIIIERKKVDYQRFYFNLNIYSLSKEWRIEQIGHPGDFILVSDLEKLSHKILKTFEISDKFGRKKTGILMDSGFHYFGIPQTNRFLDRDFVICKDD